MMRRSVSTELNGGLAALLADVPTPVRTLEQTAAMVNEKRAHARLRTAFAERDPHKAAEPTGVRMKDSRGNVQDVYGDGSIRNLWKRKEGLSGRQFRKLRKQVNRGLRARAKAEAKA